jgi:hypothetical protein
MNYTINGHQYVISHNLLTVILLLAVWELVWRGLALWRASKHNQPAWYIVMLVLNTAGILEILYLYVFGKRRTSK